MANICDWYDAVPDSVRESMQTLYSNICFSGIDDPIRTIAMTSATPKEGKSTLVCFLGIAVSEMKRRVLLVDTDFRRPQMASYFGKRNKVGLTNYVTDHKIVFDQIINETNAHGLYYVDSGSSVPNPIELFNSKRFTEFIARARDTFDLVVFDTPPLMLFVDAAITSSKVDGVVIVAKANETNAKLTKHAISQLEKAKARIIGLTLNGLGIEETSYSSYGKYGYGGQGKKKRRLLRNRE